MFLWQQSQGLGRHKEINLFMTRDTLGLTHGETNVFIITDKRRWIRQGKTTGSWKWRGKKHSKETQNSFNAHVEATHPALWMKELRGQSFAECYFLPFSLLKKCLFMLLRNGTGGFTSHTITFWMQKRSLNYWVCSMIMFISPKPTHKSGGWTSQFKPNCIF